MMSETILDYERRMITIILSGLFVDCCGLWINSFLDAVTNVFQSPEIISNNNPLWIVVDCWWIVVDCRLISCCVQLEIYFNHLRSLVTIIHTGYRMFLNNCTRGLVCFVEFGNDSYC